MKSIDTIYLIIQEQFKTLEHAEVLDPQKEQALLKNIKTLTSLIKQKAIENLERTKLLALCQTIAVFQQKGLLQNKRIIKDFASSLQTLHLKKDIPRDYVQLGSVTMPTAEALKKFAHPLRQALVKFGKEKFNDETLTKIGLTNKVELEKQNTDGISGCNHMQKLAARWLEKVSGKKILFYIYEQKGPINSFYLTQPAPSELNNILLSDDNNPSFYSLVNQADQDHYLILHTRWSNNHFYYGRDPSNTPRDNNCAYWSILQAMAQHFSLDKIEYFLKNNAPPPAAIEFQDTTPPNAQKSLLLEILCDDLVTQNVIEFEAKQNTIFKPNALHQESFVERNKIKAPLSSNNRIFATELKLASVTAAILSGLWVATIATLGGAGLISISATTFLIAIPLALAFCSSIIFYKIAQASPSKNTMPPSMNSRKTIENFIQTPVIGFNSRQAAGENPNVLSGHGYLDTQPLSTMSNKAIKNKNGDFERNLMPVDNQKIEFKASNSNKNLQCPSTLFSNKPFAVENYPEAVTITSS